MPGPLAPERRSRIASSRKRRRLVPSSMARFFAAFNSSSSISTVVFMKPLYQMPINMGLVPCGLTASTRCSKGAFEVVQYLPCVGRIEILTRRVPGGAPGLNPSVRPVQRQSVTQTVLDEISQRRLFVYAGAFGGL